LVNVDPARSLSIHAALESGNIEEARRLVAEIAAFETMRAKFGNGANVTVVKAALGLMGMPVGDVRLPGLTHLEENDSKVLASILRSWSINVG
jgi:4-hydroxy-tetrahydrodipicolinate synthase